MNSLDEAQKIYALFKTKEGSNHIAGVNAIQAIIDLCTTNRLQRVLELGSGIGTITHTLLQYSVASIDSYESNEWCRTQLAANIGNSDRLTVIPTYRLLPPQREYDLVIVDGGGGPGGDHDDAAMNTVEIFLKSLDRVGKVLVEGDRVRQRSLIRRALKDQQYLFRPVRTPSKGSEKGYTLYLVRPTRSKVRWLNWLLWEFVERSRT